ncbi:50S ribosomal protein L3 [Candidatus Pacearchaeota archaeon CG1_02_32_132]|nr:MAG: 50S ribosomal protein L3 [Candidatus Pacearchaeota archaeon CG1_02_32_132]
MPKSSRPRHGSLQFWPRKRAEKFIPSVNWKHIKADEGMLGFISYKAGMGTAIVKDNTEKSMTKGKKIAMPVTILEVPNMKILSVRFYKNGKVMKDVVVSNDKELKRKIKVSKEIKNAELDKVQGWDDIRVIVYPVMKKMFKKTPDFAEVAISGEDKLGIVKALIGREIALSEVIKWPLVDVRGLTKGKGVQGPIRRFGIKKKFHKSEKGRRNPGSISPWNPPRVTFRAPLFGQLGMFTRVHYNLKVVGSGNISEKDVNRKQGFKRYGKINNNYLVLAGSVQGPVKRQILITPALRANKKNIKREYEFLEVKF